MSVYGRVRCPICYEIAESTMDLVYHVSVSHHGTPFDQRAVKVPPPDLIEAEERAITALRSVTMWADVVGYAQMIAPFPSESFLWRMFMDRITEVLGYEELISRQRISHDQLLDLAQTIPPEKVPVLDSITDAFHELTRHPFPDTADALNTLSSPIYHTLIKSDLDDGTAAATTFANEFDWRYARLTCHVPTAMQQSLICSFMERYRFELVSRERLSRALSTDNIIRVGTCQEMVSATRVTAITFVGSASSDTIAHVAVDFQFGKRSFVTVHESGNLFGFTECLTEQWYIDLMTMYILGALVEAMLEPEYVEANTIHRPHVPSGKGSTAVSAPLGGKRYESSDHGGSHVPPGKHFVRPHLRWVGPDYILDAERRRQAMEVGLDPQKGYTLVHGHSRGLLKVEEYTDANGKRVVVYRAQRTELHLGRIFSSSSK